MCSSSFKNRTVILQFASFSFIKLCLGLRTAYWRTQNYFHKKYYQIAVLYIIIVWVLNQIEPLFHIMYCSLYFKFFFTNVVEGEEEVLSILKYWEGVFKGSMNIKWNLVTNFVISVSQMNLEGIKAENDIKRGNYNKKFYEFSKSHQID